MTKPPPRMKKKFKLDNETLEYLVHMRKRSYPDLRDWANKLEVQRRTLYYFEEGVTCSPYMVLSYTELVSPPTRKSIRDKVLGTGWGGDLVVQ